MNSSLRTALSATADQNQAIARAPHLLWIYTESPIDTLDAATWLETTRELRQLGWQVTLVTSGVTGAHLVMGVEVLGIPKPNVYVLGQLVFHLRIIIYLLLHWKQVDAVLFHQISAPWVLPVRLVRWLLGSKRPKLVMDTRTVPMRSKDKSSWRARLLDAFYPLMNEWANRWVDGQTAITARMAEAVEIPATRLWGVWPSGVNLERFALAAHARQWPVHEEPIVLAYIGSLHYERNLLTFCRAVETACREGMAFRCLIVGEGTQRAELEQFAMQTSGRIHVAPPVPHEQVPAWLAQAHIGVLPFPDEAKFHVSSPIKLFEYMASNLPILATRIACHTDVIEDGQYVFWSEDASEFGLLLALRRAWHERATLRSMGSMAAEAAPDWTWAASAAKLHRALEYGLSSS
jgi:glycosyltransferase involved in cell wall biosynthesis